LRDIAQNAPYEFIEILVNNETYGGGGIFGQFSTAAAKNDWAEYLFVHEFGHHFAGLADEYYTSPVAYQSSEVLPEPWEPNATAMRDPANLKWKHKVRPGRHYQLHGLKLCLISMQKNTSKHEYNYAHKIDLNPK
jgi:hypothetical protein